MAKQKATHPDRAVWAPPDTSCKGCLFLERIMSGSLVCTMGFPVSVKVNSAGTREDPQSVGPCLRAVTHTGLIASHDVLTSDEALTLYGRELSRVGTNPKLAWMRNHAIFYATGATKPKRPFTVNVIIRVC